MVLENYAHMNDKHFLKQLDCENIRTYYTKIIVLDMQERPISEIQGRVTGGSISVNGSSACRRTCNITFVAEESDNQLTEIDNLLGMNRKIKILIGLENHINSNYDDICWFKQGIFVICQPSISHSNSGVTISLSCKDKMCLLNGEMGGGFPAPVIFDEYDQLLSDGTTETVDEPIYDIIRTMVCNYGGEDLAKIFINDVPLETKQSVRCTNGNGIYFNSKTNQYQLTLPTTFTNSSIEDWKFFDYNEDIGYTYIDYIYPGSLESGVGDNVCTILDKIKSTLGDYEYFYDIDGNFIFQEIKNYINNSYNATETERADSMEELTSGVAVSDIDEDAVSKNGLYLLSNTNYKLSLNDNGVSVYSFDEDNGLVVSYQNTPDYSNIKNDFHVWGGEDLNIHYHVAIKDKPADWQNHSYDVVYEVDDNGDYTGKVRLATTADRLGECTVENGKLTIPASEFLYVKDSPTSRNLMSTGDGGDNSLSMLDEQIYYSAEQLKVEIEYVPHHACTIYKSIQTVDGAYTYKKTLEDTEYSKFSTEREITSAQVYDYWNTYDEWLNLGSPTTYSEENKEGYNDYVKLNEMKQNGLLLKGPLYEYFLDKFNCHVTDSEIEATGKLTKEEAYITIVQNLVNSSLYTQLNTNDEENTYNLHLPGGIVKYKPEDWRADLYLQGLQKKSVDQRPDVFEQELLDLFDNIYNFKEKTFKTDIVKSPNDLTYWFDYLEPTEKLSAYSVDNIGRKTYSYQQDKIDRLYNNTIPNVIIMNKEADNFSDLRKKCKDNGLTPAQVTSKEYAVMAENASGYTAQEALRSLIYENTNYAEKISMTSIPIYHLEPNTRITVHDAASNIYGDYIINSMSIPLDGKNTMSISATKVVDRW